MDHSKDAAPLIVLVAEDETLVRLLANDMLTDADYRVVEAHDGQEALAILGAKNTVRALLTDVNMPNVDGLALAKIVRQRWPHIGIVVTSGMPKPSGLPPGARFISLQARRCASGARTGHSRDGRRSCERGRDTQLKPVARHRASMHTMGVGVRNV